MDVQITDVASLRRLSPVALRAYLQSHGWDHKETWRNRIRIWSKEHEGQTVEVLTPLRERSNAYATRMSEVVSLLADLEGRSQLDVYYEILRARADVVRIRPLNGSHSEDWSLVNSVELLGVARNLMTAAARAAERPNQPVYRGRASAEVARYMRGIQVLPGYEDGQELTLHSLVPADYWTQTDLGDEFRPPFSRQVPFSRQATLTLNKGLLGARNAADALIGGTYDISVFEKVGTQGLSANSCEALAELTNCYKDVEISQYWAIVRPTDVVESAFVFTESDADALTAGADWLRQHNPFVDAHIKGEVVILSRDYNENFDGECVIAHEIDGRPVSLRVKLASEDHPEAIRAFEGNLQISICGDIYRSGNKYTLENPRQFLVTS